MRMTGRELFYKLNELHRRIEELASCLCKLEIGGLDHSIISKEINSLQAEFDTWANRNFIEKSVL